MKKIIIAFLLIILFSAGLAEASLPAPKNLEEDSKSFRLNGAQTFAIPAKTWNAMTPRQRQGFVEGRFDDYFDHHPLCNLANYEITMTGKEIQVNISCTVFESYPQ